MPYPLILATNGDAFARLNPDRSWSVRWDRVLDIVYHKPQPRHMAVWAYAKLLLAARDNFFVTPWDVSEKMGVWQHYEAVIDYSDLDPPPGSMMSTITFNDYMFARINFDGSWSILWNDVFKLLHEKSNDYRATALIGICEILKAAKDRFVTAAWDEPEEDE